MNESEIVNNIKLIGTTDRWMMTECFLLQKNETLTSLGVTLYNLAFSVGFTVYLSQMYLYDPWNMVAADCLIGIVSIKGSR